MAFYSRVLSIFTIIILTTASSIFAQAESSEIDSSFEAYYQEAWDKIRSSQNSDSVQNHYAEEFFEYYKINKEKESSVRAFSSAFMLWGNTGNDEYVDEALATLDNYSKLWAFILQPLGNIYARNENLEYKDYIEYLEIIEYDLTHPESKSQLLTILTQYYKFQEQTEKVRDYAQRIVELNASEFFVDFALGQLHELESLQIGQKAPHFKTETLNGNTISISDFKGEFVLLEFWGTWCGPCKPEVPHLKTLYEKYGEENLTIVGIALDEDEKVVQNYTAENEMDWPQILQSEMWEDDIVSSYNVLGVPRMYLIEPDGNIVAKDLRGEEMVNEVDRMIAEYYD